MAQGDEKPLEHVLERAIDSAEDGRVSIGGMLDAFGGRSIGPMIALFTLVAIIPPISGIPGVPTVMGLLIALLSVQIVFGRDHPWVPHFLQKLSVDVGKVAKAREKSQPWLARIDRPIGPRIAWAAGKKAQWWAALCAVLAACLMPPLELLPFVAAVPAGAVLLFGLGLTARDGLLMIAGFALTAAAVGLAVWELLGGGGA